VLAELAVPEHEAEYKLKLAGVEQAKAEVEVAARSIQAARATVDSVKLHVREAEAGVKSAQANFDLHKAHLERMKKLLESSAIEQAIVDEANLSLEAAKTALEAAEARLLAVKASVAESQAQVARAEAMRKVAEARVAVAKADVERTVATLDFAKVRAPFDGIVTRRNIFTGDFAQTPAAGKTQPLFMVARVDIVRMVIDVPESNVGQVTVGTPVTVRFAALKGQDVKAKISRLAGAIDRANGTVRAEVDLPNADGKILPGMFGTAAMGK
jgi:HlyD family secretion protein